MARFCPHCRTKVGVLAKSCWRCKYPLDLDDSESEKEFQKERKRAKKLGAMTVLLPIFLVLLGIAGIFAVIAGGDYLILFLLFLCIIPFLILLRKARKAEKVTARPRWCIPGACSCCGTSSPRRECRNGE
jgi:hypothetical protein